LEQSSQSVKQERTMSNTIGIRREDRSRWERRVPLTPDHVRRLVEEGTRVVVQSSSQRVFPDAEYRAAGAEVTDTIEGCDLILGVKEVPEGQFQRGRAYMFFSHTIKGQPGSMPMLGQILEHDCTLIDYERIADEVGRRLIHFGRFAGLAGMIDTLWALGQRYRHEGIDSPFEDVKPAHEYPTLDAAKAAIRNLGERIKTEGIPAECQPVVIGITGIGNVTSGIIDILDCLPKMWLDADDLVDLRPDDRSKHVIYVTFHTDRYLITSADGRGSFDRDNYRRDPNEYESRAHVYLDHLTILMTAAYWVPAYPRVVDTLWLKRAYADGAQPRLRVIGDIALDIEGAVEVTVKATEPDAPVYVYEPGSDKVLDGVAGHGPVILAVDFLPTELPVESSAAFGDALSEFMAFLVACDFSQPFDELDLPAPLKRAVIVHRGELTPDYAYLEDSLTGA
jgi:alpha-aminoadipic semialdehyde synthase